MRDKTATNYSVRSLSRVVRRFCHASGKSPLRAECTKGAEVGINTCGHLFADDEEVTPKMRDWLRNQLKTFLDGI